MKQTYGCLACIERNNIRVKEYDDTQSQYIVELESTGQLIKASRLNILLYNEDPNIYIKRLKKAYQVNTRK